MFKEFLDSHYRTQERFYNLFRSLLTLHMALQEASPLFLTLPRADLASQNFALTPFQELTLTTQSQFQIARRFASKYLKVDTTDFLPL